jgi:hypothetical protein
LSDPTRRSAGHVIVESHLIIGSYLTVELISWILRFRDGWIKWPNRRGGGRESTRCGHWAMLPRIWARDSVHQAADHRHAGDPRLLIRSGRSGLRWPRSRSCKALAELRKVDVHVRGEHIEPSVPTEYELRYGLYLILSVSFVIQSVSARNENSAPTRRTAVPTRHQRPSGGEQVHPENSIPAGLRVTLRPWSDPTSVPPAAIGRAARRRRGAGLSYARRKGDCSQLSD